MKHKSRRNKKSSAQSRRKKSNAVHGTGNNLANAVDRDEANERDLKGMKQWIDSLTFETLVNALEFTFQTESGSNGDYRPQQNLPTDNQGNSGSMEFDLLMEMSSYRHPCNDQWFDDFDEVENCYRRRTFCLFRWFDPDAENETNTKMANIRGEPKAAEPSREDPLAALTMGTDGMPSELLDVLARAGVKRSTSDLLQTFNEVDEFDEAFESLEDSNIGAKDPPLPTHFHLKSRHGIMDDGTSLGRGTTAEQQNADMSMLHWTVLVRDRSINISEEKLPYQPTSSLPRCSLNVFYDSPESKQQRKKLVLDTLRVASRGKFLSHPGKQRLVPMAPWFDPTEQWFSLPMYLSNRFEASLWDAYLQRSEMEKMGDASMKNSLLHSVTKLDKNALDRVLCYGVHAVMRNDFDQTKNMPTSKLKISESIKNSLFWKLFPRCENSCMLSNILHRSDGFAVTPLLEWNTPQSEFKSMFMDHLQDGLVQEAERSLMQSVSAEGSNTPKAKNIKKRRKKKRCHANQQTTKKIEDVHSGDDHNSDDDDEPRVERILPNTPTGSLLDFCEGNASHHPAQNEDNNTKMAVLKVLDEILSNVFLRLGVEDDEFSDFTHIDTAVRSVDKTRSADEIEVATTALVSNKAGDEDTVDAAMNLIQRTRRSRNHSQSPVQSQRLWASRSRRQTLEGSGQQNDASHLKRSKSSGDGTMAEKKPPVYPDKIFQPTPPRSSRDDTLWPSSDSPLFPQISQNETSIFDGAPLCLSGALDGWNSVASNHDETSIFTDLLKDGHKPATSDRIASSTAASLASSREDVADAGLDIDDDSMESPLLGCEAVHDADESGSLTDPNKAVHFKDIKAANGEKDCPPVQLSQGLQGPICGSTLADTENSNSLPNERANSPMSGIILPHDIELSPTPSAPPTPPPQLSPILVSLADLGKLRKDAASVEFLEKSDCLPTNPLPFSGIPKPPVAASFSRTLTRGLSRDDLRSIDECRKPQRRDRDVDAHHSMGHRQVDALLSYRNVVAQSAPRKPPSLKSYDGKQKLRDDAHPILGRSTRSTKTSRSGMWAPGPEFPSLSSSVSSMASYKEPILNKVLHLDVSCARSESGLDGADDASHCNVIPRLQTDDTMTKDGATTISSVHSKPETEQLATLREERNSYRDMCLTLGAENAKLRNLLASKTCTPLYHPSPHTQETMSPHFYRNDQQFEPTHNSFPNQFSTHLIVAMSDAGIHRGEYDSSAMSEDDFDLDVIGESQNSISWQARGDSVQSLGRRTSGGGTYSESSLDHNIGGQESHAFSGFRVHNQDSFFGPVPLHGIESRLSKDISRYMQSLRSQLKKTDGRRLWAVEAITKTVKALWPRAQIKMYGSHVTKLCLPSSDMDFVISLPAVHKNAPATAPGDLEGRNAIIETNQKVLARKLKSEHWIDQRSLKVIERTAVPVIKVSTKDSRCRVVQFDLSFDAKEHHGLEALNMIQHILDQLPMVRPLVLVLKQFLLDRGLLTAYTGGLSSYCLFLMVARYCQEQAPTWNDCGSLLMGLLDFYGNFFDPRTTGISVRTRQYFFRSQDAHCSPESFSDLQGWNGQFPDLTKRNSFSSKPHRFLPLHRQFSFQNTKTNNLSEKQQFKSGKFDPIWVEDPLNPGNNVGRNAFRIFQVQRAFSDAHRALVASLEWDINSMHELGDDGEYPLLKCLLQNEDVFLAIDEPIHR